jgi:hypothetical protein
MHEDPYALRNVLIKSPDHVAVCNEHGLQARNSLGLAVSDQNTLKG